MHPAGKNERIPLCEPQKELTCIKAPYTQDRENPPQSNILSGGGIRELYKLVDDVQLNVSLLGLGCVRRTLFLCLIFPASRFRKRVFTFFHPAVFLTPSPSCLIYVKFADCWVKYYPLRAT